MFAAFLCTVLFSLSVVGGHRSAKLIGGTEANFWRVMVAAVLLGIWAYGFGVGLEGDAFPLFLLSGMAGIGFGDVLFFQALPRLGPRHTTLLTQCLVPVFCAPLEWVWLGTTLTASQIVCGLVILGGVATALSPSEPSTTILRGKEARGQMALGVLFTVLAGIGGAFGAVLSRKAYAVAHAAHQPIDPLNAGFQRILGGAIIGGICLLAVKRRVFKLQASAPARVVVETAKRKWRGVWPWVLLNGLAGQTLGVSCMQWALESTPTGIVLAIIATTPIVLIPFAYLIEGERPSVRALTGGVIAVAGAVGLALSR